MSDVTKLPEHFKLLEGYARFDPVGNLSLQEAVQLVSQAIAYACEHRISKLLVNNTRLTGQYQPTVTNRYYIAREWASQSKGYVKVALVLRPQLIHPEKFGVAAAFNAGLPLNIFASETEALAWLLEERK
jgi:hypothetical protein